MTKVTPIPRNLVLPGASTLGANPFEVYRQVIQFYELEARRALDIFSNVERNLVGSNCFAPIKLREYFPQGTRLATMADLERATEINPDFPPSELHFDTGLILRTDGDSYEENHFLAKDLTEQLKKRGIKLDNPKIIYFDALNLRATRDSHYGLAYSLNESAKLGENIIDASELTSDFQFKKINDKGIPIRDDEGDKTIYTRQDGLSRFFLYGNSVVFSNCWDLAHSDVLGRVVVVNGEDSRDENQGDKN